MATLLLGPNFSGRSHWLAERRQRNKWPKAALVGPLADTTCTGLAWSIREEFGVAGLGRSTSMDTEATIVRSLGLEEVLDHELHTLSGGESVRMALASAITQGIRELQIDVALEQLDAFWRPTIMSWFLESTHRIAEAVLVADNHITPEERRFFGQIIRFPLGEEAGNQSMALMDPEAAAKLVYAAVPMKITVQGVSFAYSAKGGKIFENVSVTLDAGKLYFLIGPNGSGKTTFVKLLSGTILPRQGQLSYGSEKFDAKRSNVRFTALGFQNPDYQWTAQSVRSELSKVLRMNNFERVSSCREVLSAFGIPDEFMDRNPIELPFAIKKRLSVALAFLSGKSWVVLDEPTLGQDLTFRLALSRLIETVLTSGVGIIVISHDAYFRSVFARREELLFGNRNISRCVGRG